MGVLLTVDETLVAKGDGYLSEIRGAIRAQVTALKDQWQNLPGELAFAIAEGRAEDIVKLKRMGSELPDRIGGAEVKLCDIDIALGECRINAARATLPEAEAEAARTLKELQAAQLAYDKANAAVMRTQGFIHNQGVEQRQQARRSAELKSEMLGRARVAAAASVEQPTLPGSLRGMMR